MLILQKINNLKTDVQQRIADNPISGNSMIVTLFGDTVSQHGGWIWMGSLVAAMELFGFNERLVRTSVYRLVQSEWLETKKVGRCSYYCFTETAKSHYEKAARRIYHPEQKAWDNHWTLIIPVSIPETEREAFRKSLNWQGFKLLSTGIYAHPSPDQRSLDETITELGLADSVITLSASTLNVQSSDNLQSLSTELWDLSALQAAYENFVVFYRPWKQALDKGDLSDVDSFTLRTLLLHDFRRIILKDPNFPDEILPHGWIGHEAHDLLQKLYRRLTAPSVDYIQSSLENANGLLPPARSEFYQRFGGLNPDG